jgi:hypothetical protein
MSDFYNTGRALLAVLRAGLPPGDRAETLVFSEPEQCLVYTTELAPDRQLLVRIAIKETHAEFTRCDTLHGHTTDAARAIRSQCTGFLIAHDDHGLLGQVGEAVTA